MPESSLTVAVTGTFGFAPFAGWLELFTHPTIMDAGNAEQELGWHPRYGGLGALRDTLNREA